MPSVAAAVISIKPVWAATMFNFSVVVFLFLVTIYLIVANISSFVNVVLVLLLSSLDFDVDWLAGLELEESDPLLAENFFEFVIGLFAGGIIPVPIMDWKHIARL